MPNFAKKQMAMELNLADLIVLLICSIGIVLGTFFSIFLLITREKQPQAKIFLVLYLLAFSIRIGKSIIHNYHSLSPTIRNICLGCLLAIGPSLFLYCKHLLHPLMTIKWRNTLLHYLPFFSFISMSYFIPNNANSSFYIIYYLLNFHIAVYACYSFFYIRKSATSIEPVTLKWLNILSFVTLFVAIFFLLNLFIRLPYISLGLLFSVVILGLSFWALKNIQVFKKETPKYAKSYLSEADSLSYMQQLNMLMKKDKLYLDPDITLAKLSKQLGINRKKLSQAINQTTQNNYSKYIASLRVEEAKRLLADPNNEKYKIAAIAYDSGFNSLSSFNNTFKQLVGITAVNYRKNRLNNT